MAYDGIMMHQVKNLLIETIKGGRINKIYQISKYELLFQVRANKKNYQLLISSHPMYARVQLTSLSYPTPESPNPLTMLYRKLLDCLLYTSDAADDLLCVDLGGRRIIKKKVRHL